jgi:cytidine deaminase
VTGTERQDLLAAARAAALRAYAPYSGFRVGAAVLTPEGMVTGANVENASYGLTLCAERAALAAAVARGQGPVRGVAVACIDAAAGAGLAGRMPCGACRQWLAELAPEAEVVIDGEAAVFTVAELLPAAFRAGSKGPRAGGR